MGSSSDICEALGVSMTSWKPDNTGVWSSAKAEIDFGVMEQFFEKYIKDNFTVDVVSWGENKISFQVLLKGKVVTEKTIELNLEKIDD